MCGWGAWNIVAACGPVKGICGPGVYGLDWVLDIAIGLHPFNVLQDSYMLLFHSLPVFQSHSSWINDSGWSKREMGLLGSILHVGKSGAHPNTLFPLWDKAQATKRQCLLTLRCAALGRVMQVKSNCSSYPSLQCIQICIFFLHWHAGTSPLETWTSKKSSLSMGNCLRQHFPGTPRPWLKRAGEGSWAAIAGTELGQRSLCLLSVTWVAMTLRVTWWIVLDPTDPLYVDGCQIVTEACVRMNEECLGHVGDITPKMR